MIEKVPTIGMPQIPNMGFRTAGFNLLDGWIDPGVLRVMKDPDAVSARRRNRPALSLFS